MSRPSAVLYDLAKTVAHVLSLPLALHHTLAPRLAHLKDDDPDSHKYDNVPPELALLVAVIIVLKMVYGLDGKLRYAREPCIPIQALRLPPIRVPNNSTDPACALPRTEDYFMIFKEVKEAHMRSTEVLFSATSDM
jgi:RNA polymerase I-specific transcription initiation factor RRN7